MNSVKSKNQTSKNTDFENPKTTQYSKITKTTRTMNTRTNTEIEARPNQKFKDTYFFEETWLKESLGIDIIKDICYYLMNNNKL
jgi:hypothetical protein